MIISDIVRYAFKAMTERKFRAFLTIIGIAIGPLALVMMTGVVRGYSNYVQEQLLSLGQNSIFVFSTGQYILKQSDLDYIRTIDGVDKADPFYLTTAYVQTPEGTKQVRVYALDMDMLKAAFGNLKIMKGAYPLPNQPLYAVIGYKVAFSEKSGTQFYDVGDALTLYIPKIEGGGTTKLDKAVVRVKGIFAEYGGAMFLSPDTGVFLPLDAGKKVLKMNRWTGIMILAKSPNYVEAIVNELRKVYSGKVDIIAFQQIAKIIGSVTAAMDFITFSASLSAFAVAVAGTASTMITSVIERTREIGVLKAIGFTDGQVMAMIIAESILMSLVGGAIGITLGVVGAYAMASRGMTIRGATQPIVIKAPPAITPELIGMTLVITIAVGVLGGLFPAYRAAKLPPVVALRYE